MNDSMPPRANQVCAAFQLGCFISSSQAGGSRNVCHVFRANGGKWFVRQRHPGYCDEDRLQFDRAAMLYLMNSGVPVKLPLTSGDGNTWWHDGKALWEVFEFVEGQNMRAGNKRDNALLGRALGKFHRAGTGFGPRHEKLGVRGETDPERLLANAGKLKATARLKRAILAGKSGGAERDSRLIIGHPSELDRILAPYERLIAQAANDFPIEAYLTLPHTLVHGDIQPANIIIGGDGVNAFVDFDWCAWRPRIYDLAYAILFCCSSHERPLGKGDIWALTQTPAFNAPAAESFMNAYEQNAGPLSGEERQYLGPQMALAWCHARIDGAFKTPEKQRKKFLSRPFPMDIFMTYSTLNCEPRTIN